MDPHTVLDGVAAIRHALHRDFQPRAARALKRRPVIVSEENIGGISCMIIGPAQGAANGTVLYFFGGGYVSGAPEYDLPITAALCALGRLRIIAPRYALAPENPFPAGLNDCIRVFETVSATEPRLVLSGESAGGGMAMAVTRAASDKSLPEPAGLALFSPWSDLTAEGITASVGIDDPTITTGDLRLCARAYLGKAPATDPLASPGSAPFPAAWPDTLLTTGSRDILRPSVLRDAATMRRTGARVTLTDRPGLCHVFEVYDDIPEALPSLRRAAEFCVTALGNP